MREKHAVYSFRNHMSSTLFQRTTTNVTVSIVKSIFYVSNVQETIARQTEIIFHNLLFTIVVLELFGLLFLIMKLFIAPLFHIIFQRVQYIFKKSRVNVSKDSDLTKLVVNKINFPTNDKLGLTMKSHRRWSTITGTVPASHE
jgi:hypothetical protein